MPRELFGLKKNPREQTNLIDTMEWVQQTGRLKQELEGFRIRQDICFSHGDDHPKIQNSLPVLVSLGFIPKSIDQSPHSIISISQHTVYGLNQSPVT